MNVAGLPWNEPLIERIVQLRDSDILPHAIALTAAQGWGLSALANDVCASLLEVDPGTDMSQLAHPDLRWVVPDGAMVKVDQVRRVNEFAVQTPQLAGRKVALINDAHLLNDNAANALLKTLEEPPPNTHIVLATHRWGKLLPTIRSRCRQMQPVQSSVAARAWLKERKVDVSEQDFALLGFAPLTAAGDDPGAFLTWIDALDAGDASGVNEVPAEADLVDWLARWYRHVLAQAADDPKRARPLFEFSDELTEIRRQIETSNAANTRLLLERLVVIWRKIHPS